MAIGNLIKPPLAITDVSDYGWKKWFNSAWNYTQSGVLIPVGGTLASPVYGTSRRNLIMNGDFHIWQRGTSFLDGASTTLWTADRWAITTAAQNVVQVTGGSIPGLTSSAKVFRTAGNTATALMYLAQAIESAKIQQIAGLPVVLSYWINCGSTFNAHSQVQANIINGAYSGTVMSVMQSGTGVDEGVFAAYTGSKFFSVLTITPRAGSWIYVQQQGTIPSNAKELKVYFQITPTATAGDANSFYQITGVQLEVGLTPTAFDYTSFGDQLEDCERFFQKSFPYATAPVAGAAVTGMTAYLCTIASTTTGNGVAVEFSPRMYKTPAMAFYTPVGAGTKWWNSTLAALSGAVTANFIGDSGVLLTNPQITTDAVKNLIGTHWVAGADV